MLILPDKSIAVWKTFWDDNKVLVYKYVVKQVNIAINNNKSRAVLFGFESNDFKVWVEKDKYVDSLEKALDVFVKEEEFELASKTKKIIDKFIIDELINSSSRLEE